MKRNKINNKNRLVNKKKRRGKSQIAKKREYLNRTGLFGFEVPEPKPWK